MQENQRKPEPPAHTPEPGGGKPDPRMVKILINTVPYEVEQCPYKVSELKLIAKIPAADELLEIVDGKLKPLNDNQAVPIKGGEQFVSQPRGGASS